jgi:gamma-glutamyltranspeptidase/glutathione hydrolase
VTTPGAPSLETRGSRSVALGQKGMVATSQPQASVAGLDVLRQGGNAIDAAVTAAAVLTVVEPSMTGIGGDLFALVHAGDDGRTHGLNASGRTPAAASVDTLRQQGHDQMPDSGLLPITVPGAVDGWAKLLAAHGTISLADALEPAIGCAREGFPVNEVVARQWQDAAPLLATDPAAAATFLPDGRPPAPGERFANPRLAASLSAIAEEGPRVFYQGALAEAIGGDIEQRGGWLTARDLAAHRSDAVDPIRTSFRNIELIELPPNTQGFVALEALNVLNDEPLETLEHNGADYLHLVIEALAIAFADRAAHLADPDAVPAETLARLISKEYARERRQQIRMDRTQSNSSPVTPASGGSQAAGDTVYLAAADDQGNLVSLIQSLYAGFGSGIVAGETGIVLHNRGAMFTTDPDHANVLAPSKRPLHTLAPALAHRDGRPWLAYGVMGGDMQPQGHLQVLLNLVCFGMNIQQAGEAPRARYDPSGISLEAGVDARVLTDLVNRGHRAGPDLGFGGFQGVLVDQDSGVLMGGSDPRKDGVALGW